MKSHMVSMTLEGANELQVELTSASARVDRALVRSLNRAIAAARTVEVREIARDMGLKSGDVRTSLKMREASSSRFEASLSASLKRIPLEKFGARGPEPSRGQGRGVTYKIGTSGRSRAERGFLATMRSGHRGVFMRTGKSRLPIRELFGPSLGHVFLKYRPLALARAKEAFQTNFEHEVIFAGRNG